MAVVLAMGVIAAACGGAATATTTTHAAPVTTAATTTAPPTETTIRSASTTSAAAESTTTTAAAFPSDSSSDQWTVEVVSRYPHDSRAFTQGLVVRDGMLYESTGRYGESTIRVADRDTGAVLSVVAIGDGFFGEGLEWVDGRLVQLTWLEETALVWDANTLEPLPSSAYTGEGWGLCLDGERFVMSDGSATLSFRDPESFAATGSVEVTRDGEPIDQLNELECVDGLVFANVWQTDEIVVIDPTSGAVVATVDASALVTEVASSDPAAALNGIAYDTDRRAFLVTGKLWPTVFEVRFVVAT